MVKICEHCGGAGNLFAAGRFASGSKLSQSFDWCSHCGGTGQTGLDKADQLRILEEKEKIRNIINSQARWEK